MITVIGGKPGLITAAQVVGATGGIFKDSAGNQFNINAPGSSRLEQTPFVVKAAGYVTLPAGTYTATLVAALYGVAGSAAWTAGSGNQIALSGSQSFTQAGTASVTVPFYVEAQCEGDSVSGVLQGRYSAIVNDILTAPVLLANKPTSVNFATEPPLQFAAGVTLANAGATAICNLGNFFLEAA